MEARTSTKSELSEPVRLKSSLQNGCYVWHYGTSYSQWKSSLQNGCYVAQNGCHVWQNGIYGASNSYPSDNFYPGSANSTWKVYLEEKPNYITVQLRVSNAQEVPVRFEFTIQRKHFTLILKEKGSNCYDISSFPHNELFAAKIESQIIQVRWLVDVFTSTEDLPAALIQDFASLLDSGKFSDVEIETEDGSRISAHRAILSARSSVFCAMLESEMLETKTRRIKITDFPAQTVKDMVTFMYTSRLPKYNYECATELLKAADKYDLKDLKRACTDSLSLNLTVDNAVKVLLLADVYREDSLKRKALDFISENLSAFTDPSKFDSSLNQRPDLLIEVISSIAKSQS